jgi:hypothetical protein
MTEEKTAGVFLIMISPNIITVRRIRKTALPTASLHPRYQPGLFRDRTCPLFAAGNNSLRHHGGGGDLANCECGRIHKALPIVDLDSSSGDLLPISGLLFCHVERSRDISNFDGDKSEIPQS